MTYIQAPTPSGMQSTLQVRVNGAAWSEVVTLYQQPSTARVFATLNESDGTTDVHFGGDGEGSLLPTGQNNLIANYRIGAGAAGNVAAGAITTLMDRPLGVSGVTNPQSATGGQDPQSVDDIRVQQPCSRQPRQHPPCPPVPFRIPKPMPEHPDQHHTPEPA